MSEATHVLRQLRRAPVFAAIAVATLGLGIGASTATFTVVDSVLLRPLRFADPQHLAIIRPTTGARVSASYLYEWRAQNRSATDIAGWRDVRATLIGREETTEVLVDQTTANYFDVLGAAPYLGRTFAFSGDVGHVDPEVLLSYGFWQRRFGGALDVVGQSIVLDGGTRTIVGVMPEGFTIRTNERAESHAEMWVPFPLEPGDRTGMGGDLNVVARIRPGATSHEVQSELQLIARRIEQAYPSYSRDWSIEVVPLLDATVRDVRPTLLVLFGAVGILLLLACANVATLTLSRTTSRHTEFVVRRAVGATAVALVRQALMETFVLTCLAGTVGVVLAIWGTRLLVHILPAGLELPRSAEIGVDLRVLAFAMLVTIGGTLLCAVAPAIAAARTSSGGGLTDLTRGHSTSRRQARLAGLLIVSEVTLAMVLLAGAGLLGRSFWELVQVRPGFQAHHVLTMRTTLSEPAYGSDERVRAFSTSLLERLDQLPGIEAVGVVDYLPMTHIGRADVFDIAGRPRVGPDERPSSWVSVVGGHYFDAMGIPLLRGRLPDSSDTQSTPPVFVIDEELARRYWPDQDPLGARLVWRRDQDGTLSGDIVGVVGHVRWTGVATRPQPTTYFWWPQNPGRDLTIVTRTAGEPAAIAAMVSAEVKAIDPRQPVAGVRTMDDLVAADLARPRFTMWLLGAFAAAALLMAALGLYGVIATAVADRTREIGVRIAIGAQRRDVLRLVMRRGALLVGVGLATGVASALALGRYVAGLLYGIRPHDPATLAAAAGFLLAVAWLAIYVPACRATRVDPMAALKAE